MGCAIVPIPSAIVGSIHSQFEGKVMTMPIAELAVSCRYQVLKRSRDPGRYDSAECGEHATSGIHETGSHFTGTSWRCEAHRGQIRLGASAEVIESAERTDYLRYVA
jgi:hypothetical protein